MGTRFLYYQINDFQQKEVMNKILEGSDKGEEEKSKEIAEVIEKFIYEADQREIETISDEVKEELKTIAKWTAKMRASGEFDRYNNELKGTITPEKPTRILKQFRKIYVNLKKLRKDYPDDRALSIIQKIGASNIDPDKRQIYIEIDTTDGLELTDLVDRMGIGRKAIKRRLLEMENVGIVKTDIDYNADSDRLTYGAWYITDEFKDLADEFTPQ
jgi:glutamate synthase domain-containing protein 3